MNKNVSVILCHPSDTLKTPEKFYVAGTPELLLVDNKDGSFEIQGIDSSGTPYDISKHAQLCVLASAPNLAEEPKGMTFRLSGPSENVIVTVIVTWKIGGPGPFEFQLRTRTNDEGVATVVPVDPVPGNAFIDADIRGTSHNGDLPQDSAIRKRANEVVAKKKAEIEAKAKPRPIQPKPIPNQSR